jgi:uncharacterized membrane protein
MEAELRASKTIENEITTIRRIRNTIGVLSFSLPIVLFILSLIPFFNTALQSSISSYYYTNLRELFTGALCAVGLFLIRYRGHPNPNFFKNDSKLTNIAGAMAIGIAFLPTNPNSSTDKIYSLIPLSHEWLGWLHLIFAAIFFLTLSIISINVFTIGQKENHDIPFHVANENNIYRCCGYFMLVLIVATPICEYFKVFTNSTFYLEALMLFAFGFSWLVKGRVFGDKGKIGRIVYREIH